MPDFAIWNKAEKVGDAVEACPALVVRAKDEPRSALGIGRLQHHVSCARVVVPAVPRFQVHGAKFPLLDGIADACLKATLLLFLADLEPILDQNDSSSHDLLFEEWADIEKTLVLLPSTESHHIFDASTVVPATVEDDNLASRWEVLEISLHIHLCSFAIRWSRQRNLAKHSRADALSDGSDRAALPRRIAAFEYDYYAKTFLLDPLLEFAELGLKAAQFVLVLFSAKAIIAICIMIGVFGHRHRDSPLIKTPPVRKRETLQVLPVGIIQL